MTDKITIQRAFNTLLFEFLRDIQSVYPDNKEIAYAADSFETVKRMNPSIIIRSWHKYVYLPYANYIDGGDLDFFLNKSYAEDMSQVSSGKDDFLKMIDKVRKPLQEMEDVNKEHTKEYLRKLNKLSQIWGQCN
jgi:hypothetical protein